MDAQRIVRGHLDVAARPLLRTFVQAVYAYAGLASAQDPAAGGGKGAAAAAVMGSLGPEYRTPYLEEQVVRLKSIRTLLLAMEVGRDGEDGGWTEGRVPQDGNAADGLRSQSCPLPLVGSPVEFCNRAPLPSAVLPLPPSQVSACLPDEMLVQEGALRAHNLLAPLLALRDPPPLVHKALAALHLGLQGVANLVQVGGEGDREEAKPIPALGASRKLGAPCLQKRMFSFLTPWSV